jgi:hypothetical protein
MLAMATLLVTLSVPEVGASPDGDSIAEIRIDGAATVRSGEMLVELIQIDDDVEGDEVGVISFTLVIPEICRDNPSDTSPLGLKMRGITVRMDEAWTLKYFSVEKTETSHEVTIAVAALMNGVNVNTADGRNIAEIMCTVEVAGMTSVTQTFEDIRVRKWVPDTPIDLVDLNVTGEPKPKLAVEPGIGLPKADISGDGMIDDDDVQILSDHLSGRAALTGQQRFKADVFPSKADTGGVTCGDGVVNLNDLLTLILVNERELDLMEQC